MQVVVREERIGFNDAFAPVKLAAARNAIAALALDRRVARRNDTASDVNLCVIRFVVAPQNAVIERVEVVRGGGSSLYGSSAIGGTVNVITKLPKTNSFDINYTLQNINTQSVDEILNYLY